MFISQNSPWSMTWNTATWAYRLISSCIHPYTLLSDCVLSSFRTSRVSIEESTLVNIHTNQYCAVIIWKTAYLTLHWVHTRHRMFFIPLIAFEEPVTFQNWCASTNINILTTFIQFILSLSARTTIIIRILHITSQYCSMRISNACQYISVSVGNGFR